MGGRGSAYNTLSNKLDEIRQEQYEIYDGEPVSYYDFLLDPESTIHDEMFNKLKELGFSTRESTDAANKYNLTLQQKQLEFLATEFDYILNENGVDVQFGTEDMYDSTQGYTSPFHNERGELMQRIVYRRDKLNSIKDTRELISKAVKNQDNVPIDIQANANKYIITHEMGHVIENCIFEKLLKQNPNNSMYYDTRKVAIKIRGEVEDICKNKYTKNGENVRMQLSEYSKVNSKEWFAETFTNLILAEDHPEPIALALNDYIRRFE